MAQFQWKSLLISITLSLILTGILWILSEILWKTFGITIPWFVWIIFILVFLYLILYIQDKHYEKKEVNYQKLLI